MAESAMYLSFAKNIRGGAMAIDKRLI